jgi:hypothetical protein
MEAVLQHDHPGAAWRLLDTRSVVVAAPLVALGLTGYFAVRQAGDMSGMVMGLGQVGRDKLLTPVAGAGLAGLGVVVAIGPSVLPAISN